MYRITSAGREVNGTPAEKVNSGQAKSAQIDFAIDAVFYCGPKCKNTLAAWGESSTRILQFMRVGH